MNWLEFKDAVKESLHVHATRAGAGTLIARKIADGVRDVQTHCEFYRIGHEDSITFAEFTVNAAAAYADVPTGAFPMKIEKRIRGDGCSRNPMERYPWANLEDMICGKTCAAGCAYLYAIDPRGERLWIAPALVDGEEIILTWDGLKADFDDGDEVPFDDQMAEVVSEYVLIFIRREVEKEYPGAREVERSWRTKRLMLFANSRERTRMRYQQRSPALNCPAPVCGCLEYEPDESAIAAPYEPYEPYE